MRIAKSCKNWLYLLAAPLLTAVFLLCFYALAGYYPFGSGVISWCDMDQQVVPLLLNFKDILSGEGSALYSLQNAGGMNFWGVFFFFIASPFSFLTLLVDKSDMLSFMNLMVLLKLSTCAFTASLYFKCTRRRIRPELAALFGVFYAFSGYGLLFYQNIIWLDMMYLFPLLLLSFEHLVYTKKAAWYIVTLSAMMVVNYYISYMVVLFTLLYFGITVLTLTEKRRKQVALHFLAGSLVAALLTAVIWLPSFLQYLSSGRDISMLESLSSSPLYTAYETTLAVLLPSSCAIIIVIYGLLHQPLRGGRLRNYLLLFILLFIPFVIEPINKMWHTGNYQGFPVRYGFMTVFMLLTVAAQVITRTTDALPSSKPSYGFRQTWGPLLLLLTGILLYGVFSHYYIESHQEVLTSYSRTLWGTTESLKGLLILFFFSALLYLFLYRGLYKRHFSLKIFILGCLLLFFLESYANTRIYLFSSDYDWHLERYQNAMALSGFTPEEEETNEFYRVKLRQKYFDVNLVGGLGFPSLSHYTSLTSQDYMFAMKKLGYSSYWMEVGGYSGSVLSDAALSVAYDIHWFDDEPAVYRTQQFHISKTPFYLPLGLATTETLADTNELDDLTRLEVQKLLYRKLFPGQPSPFREYHPNHSQDCLLYRDDWDQYQIDLRDGSQLGHFLYHIRVEGRQTLYFDCFDRLSNDLSEHINGSFHVYVNGVALEENYPSKLNNGLVNLGTFENETVEVDIQVVQGVTCRSFGIFGIDHAILGEAIAQAQPLHLQADDRTISGEITAGEEQTVFLSIPYDAGWTLEIDGQKAELTQAFLGFTAFTVPAGHHTLALSYLPPGFSLGLSLTALALILCLAFWILKKRRPAVVSAFFDSNRLQTVSSFTVALLFVVVILMVYVLPMILALYHTNLA